MTRQAGNLVAATMLAVATTACTHSMHVKNLDEYVKSATAGRPLWIVIEDTSTDTDEREYFTYVHEALATHPAVDKVALRSNVPADFAGGTAMVRCDSSKRLAEPAPRSSMNICAPFEAGS